MLRKRLVSAALIACMASAHARTAGAELLDRAAARTDRERIVALLQRPEVVTQLQARGVDAAQARARVAALTDEEIAALAAGIDERAAGGSTPHADRIDSYVLRAQVTVLLVLLGVLLVAALLRVIGQSLKRGVS